MTMHGSGFEMICFFLDQSMQLLPANYEKVLQRKRHQRSLSHPFSLRVQNFQKPATLMAGCRTQMHHSGYLKILFLNYRFFLFNYFFNYKKKSRRLSFSFHINFVQSSWRYFLRTSSHLKSLKRTDLWCLQSCGAILMTILDTGRGKINVFFIHIFTLFKSWNEPVSSKKQKKKSIEKSNSNSLSSSYCISASS